jgi:hypothetical protein
MRPSHNIKKICFFNHWHNGDVFAGKGFMQNLMEQLPWIRFQHAQLNNLKTMSDLPCEQLHIDQLPAEVNYMTRYTDYYDTLYINTWIGCYGGEVMPAGENHANWSSLYTMWQKINWFVGNVFDRSIEMSDDVSQYIPTTDWAPYDIIPAMQFLGQKDKLALFCNGRVRSLQSNVGDMKWTIERLAKEFPDTAFVCTQKFDDETDIPGNIYFTDDIFKDVENGDINEIAFLSTRADLIVGKNSGPYMFTHVKENILDPNKIFVSLSHHSSESYASGCKGFPCHYYHYKGDDEPEILGIIRQALLDRKTPFPGEMVIIEAVN